MTQLLLRPWALLFVVAAACGETPPPPVTPAPEPAAKTAPEPAARAASTELCSATRTCTDCPNEPFQATDCYTTQYGPARANVITLKPDVLPNKAQNMLYCDKGDYALCYYSGPKTQTPGAGGAAVELPCVLNAAGDAAICTCEAFTDSYYVDIHAIGNLNVYYQTIDTCGREGERCWNMSNADSFDPTSHTIARAPVCDYIRDQNAADPKVSLMPGAALISAFSYKMQPPFVIGSTECPNTDKKLSYAGCMTAACTFPGAAPTRPAGGYNGELVECSCPLWNGPYQVGQAVSAAQCDANTYGTTEGLTYVWSAAYSTTLPAPGDATP